MEGVGAWEYGAVFVGTTLLTLLFTPLALRLAVRRGILDLPSEIKAQASPVPYLGGAAMVSAFAAVLLGAAAVRHPHGGVVELAIILGIALVLAAIGLADDLRGLSAVLRVAVEVAAGVAVWATPAGADVFRNDLLNLLVTVVWVVGVTNAVNLLDNMDGLSSGVSAIAALGVFTMAANNGQFLVATLAIAISGCAIGFLRSNFYPARIYMGDAGSLFLGFVLSVLALKLEFLDAPPLVALGVPIVVLLVPLFDTALVMVNRLAHGRSPFVGGRDHVSHRLVFIGVPVPVAVLIIYVAAGSMSCLAIVLAQLDTGTGVVLLGWLATLGLLGGTLLSAVPVYETSRRRHLMLQEVQRHEPLNAPDEGAA
jgi:UDP-GlcNAc:undecaprenyl-phosphate GlcNAc-1-phosphate transferase